MSRVGLTILLWVACLWGLAFMAPDATAIPAQAAKWEPVVRKYFNKYSIQVKHRRVTHREVRTALYITWVESRSRRLARNGRYVGMFQCDIAHFQGRYPWTAVSQAATAAMLWVRQGWKPWPWYRTTPASWQ